MVKNIIAVVAGLAVWMIVVTIAGFIIRVSWPAYAGVANAMTFTLPMMIARLSIGALATIAMGSVTAVIARSVIAKLMPGIVMLVLFIPQHMMLWEKFPVWYHLTFLLCLVPLTWAGAHVAGWRIHSDRIAVNRPTRMARLAGK
jgi:hypothetical protein